MVKSILERMCWAIAFSVVIAFFLPWLKAKGHGAMDYAHSELKKQEVVEDANRPLGESYFMLRTEEIRDALSDPLDGTSGWALLLMTRSEKPDDREKARKMISFLGNMESREAGILIYAVPACALISACFFTVAIRVRWLFLIPLALCGLLYTFLRTGLNETYFDRLVLDLPVGLGLWISLYGLLVIIILLAIRVAFGKS